MLSSAFAVAHFIVEGIWQKRCPFLNNPGLWEYPKLIGIALLLFLFVLLL